MHTPSGSAKPCTRHTDNNITVQLKIEPFPTIEDLEFQEVLGGAKMTKIKGQRLVNEKENEKMENTKELSEKRCVSVEIT